MDFEMDYLSDLDSVLMIFDIVLENSLLENFFLRFLDFLQGFGHWMKKHKNLLGMNWTDQNDCRNDSQKFYRNLFYRNIEFVLNNDFQSDYQNGLEKVSQTRSVLEFLANPCIGLNYQNYLVEILGFEIID